MASIYRRLGKSWEAAVSGLVQEADWWRFMSTRSIRGRCLFVDHALYLSNVVEDCALRLLHELPQAKALQRGVLFDETVHVVDIWGTVIRKTTTCSIDRSIERRAGGRKSGTKNQRRMLSSKQMKDARKSMKKRWSRASGESNQGPLSSTKSMSSASTPRAIILHACMSRSEFQWCGKRKAPSGVSRFRVYLLVQQGHQTNSKPFNRLNCQTYSAAKKSLSSSVPHAADAHSVACPRVEN